MYSIVEDSIKTKNENEYKRIKYLYFFFLSKMECNFWLFMYKNERNDTWYNDYSPCDIFSEAFYLFHQAVTCLHQVLSDQYLYFVLKCATKILKTVHR